MQFLQNSAANLREQLMKDGDSDSFPKELDQFLEKKFLFKIQISDYNLRQNWSIFTVIRMCDDTSIIDTYLATSNIIQGVEDHVDFDHSLIGSESIAEVEHDTLSVSCSSSSITPMKRVAVDTFNQPNSSEDLTPAQMSCNKKKQIKIEKNDFDNVEE
ncbi:hypothetical protein Taro_025089 [Colocasia esculenta]|uniref:Uncharacterized protein n=1 Tax=Colocasia esculenta TaxID=4460 RepID=A0A843VFI3_COLES|nr:hypothetical protein [Colocasia esculenta]